MIEIHISSCRGWGFYMSRWRSMLISNGACRQLRSEANVLLTKSPLQRSRIQWAIYMSRRQPMSIQIGAFCQLRWEQRVASNKSPEVTNSMSHLHVTMTANTYKYWHILATVVGSQRFADNKTSSKITNSMRHLHGSHRYRLIDFGMAFGKYRLALFGNCFETPTLKKDWCTLTTICNWSDHKNEA